jgi:hypothetical protein
LEVTIAAVIGVLHGRIQHNSMRTGHTQLSSSVGFASNDNTTLEHHQQQWKRSLPNAFSCWTAAIFHCNVN